MVILVKKGGKNLSPRNRNAKLNFVCSTLIGVLISVIIQLSLKSKNSCKMIDRIQNIYHGLPHLSSSLNMLKQRDASESQKIRSIHEDSDLVLIGVMTAKKFLNSRVMAGHKTWVKTIPGKVIYFCSDMDHDSTSNTQQPYPNNNIINGSKDDLTSNERTENFRPKRVYVKNEAGQIEPEGPVVISLPGVTDAYPPQKKSFMMFKFMYENYGERFKWFVRADDDVYIKGDHLASWLRSLNSNEPHFIGQAGQGMKEEMGLLNLNYDENFCMGGPSMILSVETLRKMAPHIKYCVNHLYTFHEDIEIGRCIKTFAGVPCTWAYENLNLFLHHSGTIWIRNDTRNSKKAFDLAMTLHPFKRHEGFYDAHAYFLTQKILKYREYHNQLLIQRSKMREQLTRQQQQLDNVMQPNKHLKKRRRAPDNAAVNNIDAEIMDSRNRYASFFVIRDILLESHVKNNPRQKVGNNVQQAMSNVREDLTKYIDDLGRSKGIHIAQSKILWYYMTTENPVYNDVYLSLHLNHYQQSSKIGKWLEARFRIRRPYYETLLFVEAESGNYHRQTTKLPNQLIPSTSQTGHEIYDPTTINFIVPILGRLETFKRFLRNFEETCIHKNERATLTIVVFHNTTATGLDEGGDYEGGAGMDDKSYVKLLPTNEHTALVDELVSKYPAYKQRLRYLLVKGEFSRGLALELGASQYASDDLLFFVDVDMLFNRETLHRIRFFTRLNNSMYYPVVFSQYNPQFRMLNQSYHLSYINGTTSHGKFPDITAVEGYWRTYGFGIASIYKRDFDGVGGFDMGIFGWGKEDVDLFDKSIAKKYQVFHSPDPGLIHIFHDSSCPTNLPGDQYVMCLKSRANNLGANQVLFEQIQ